jgi:hypothetical protein
MNIHLLLGWNLVVKPVLVTVAGPFILHEGSQPRPASVVYGMEHNASKLSGQSSFTTFETNFLVLVMQLVVSCKHVRGGTASVGVDCPNKFPNLHNGVQRQLVQLDPELVQNVHEYRMQ